MTSERIWRRSGDRRCCLLASHSTNCHPERSISFANAKVVRSRRTPVKHAALETRQGILTASSAQREFHEAVRELRAAPGSFDFVTASLREAVPALRMA